MYTAEEPPTGEREYNRLERILQAEEPPKGGRAPYWPESPSQAGETPTGDRAPYRQERILQARESPQQAPTIHFICIELFRKLKEALEEEEEEDLY